MTERGLKFFRQHQALRFLVVGIYNTLIGIATFPMLYALLPSMRPYYLGLLILSQLLCITNAYLSYKYWVFRRKGLNLWEYLRFTLFYNIVFAVNLLLLPLLVHLSQISPAKLQIGISILIALSSYAWHKWVSFR